MSTESLNEAALRIELEPADNHRLAALCGPFDEHLRQVEQRHGVRVRRRGQEFDIIGRPAAASAAAQTLEHLYSETARGLSAEDVHLVLRSSSPEVPADPAQRDTDDSVGIQIGRRREIRPRSSTQIRYVRQMGSHDLNFAVGPAGTGKTYLAVACAVEALLEERVKRLVLVRPAVEAGEKLGFLPGDLAQKVDPYLRPIYDALYEMLTFERVAKLIERSVIEVAPLAYMRGRTLNEAFVILDEAQNTTPAQMKMFLTRIGFGARAVVTGDLTQVDLPKSELSGLAHALRVLEGVDGIAFSHFTARDVVRHPLVERIINAYEARDDGE